MVASIPDIIPPPRAGPLEAVDEVNFTFKFQKKKIFVLNQD